MKIYNLLGRSGRAVPNQFVFENAEKIIFQSYQSVCAVYFKRMGILAFGEDWDYSRTTLKYLHQFLEDYIPHKYYDITKFEMVDLPYHGKSVKELRKMLDKGIIEYLPKQVLDCM